MFKAMRLCRVDSDKRIKEWIKRFGNKNKRIQ